MTHLLEEFWVLGNLWHRLLHHRILHHFMHRFWRLRHSHEHRKAKRISCGCGALCLICFCRWGRCRWCWCACWTGKRLGCGGWIRKERKSCKGICCSRLGRRPVCGSYQRRQSILKGVDDICNKEGEDSRSSMGFVLGVIQFNSLVCREREEKLLSFRWLDDEDKLKKEGREVSTPGAHGFGSAVVAGSGDWADAGLAKRSSKTFPEVDEVVEVALEAARVMGSCKYWA